MRALLPAAFLLSACGGHASAVAGPDAATDAKFEPESGTAADAGWTQCTSPEGYAVCGGPSQCSATSTACSQCGNPVLGAMTDGGLNACVNSALLTSEGDAAQLCWEACPDGAVCVDLFQDATYFCAPYDLGVLFAKNGAADQVRYADMGLWTDASLPLPTTCPNITGLQVCGGNCAPCPTGATCTGRSPLHPYSFCVPVGTEGPCDAGAGCGNAGNGCFTYAVQPSAQPLANKNGMCLPDALCKSAASNLPGGGTCSM
jgi:hypothetical protein